MNWDMNDDTSPVDDLGSVENALRHELNGSFVPFDGARAEEMIDAATRAHVSRLPRMAAPLGTAAAVLALGAGVAVFAANGTGNSPAPAGGPSQTPTGHASCAGAVSGVAPRLVPIRRMHFRATEMPQVVPTVRPTGPRKVYHLPPRLVPGHPPPYQSRLNCSTGGPITACVVVPPRRLDGSLLRRKALCPIRPPSARVLPRMSGAPVPMITRSAARLRVPPPSPPAAAPLTTSPAPTAIRSGARLLVPPRDR